MSEIPSTPSATNIPVPQSYEQILSDMLSSYASKVGVNDENVGSAVTSFFEVVALTTARASGDIFQILRDFSIDRATGDALQRLAQEYNVIPITASPATGYVSVIDSSFQKISTSIYAGAVAPNIGTVVINVGNAAQFPSSGSIYIGRGTPNIEGPLSYSTPPVQVGNYWTITLSNPTTKFHNLGESVILAQGGNRIVPLNTIVISPAIGTNPDVQYNIAQAATILDGETTVNNVPITAVLPGSTGNVPIGAINEFSSAPFNGATVSNPLALNDGADNETDDQLRIRIKNALASIGLGTAFAVESAVLGATSTSPVSATVTSTDLLQASYGAVLYIDNGQGYEETSTGVGLESIVTSALGGEQFFQLSCGGNQSSVAKAFLQSTLSSPFAVQGGDTLAVVIGGVTYQHTFATSDFRSPNAATAYEIAASINADTSLSFEALTAGSGTYVVIRSNNESTASIEVTTPITSGRDAAVQMGFPTGTVETLRLYKNGLPLNQYGNTATVSTTEQSIWSSSITNNDTLILSVDNTASITYNILDSDFIATGLYTSVSNTNSLESWVEVFNNKLTGVTAEVVGNQIQITSNLGASSRASVVINSSSSLVQKGMFSLSALSSTGNAADYTLSRNTAQFELTNPLSVGDTLSAGSNATAASIKSAQIAVGSVTLTSNAYLWLLIDNPGSIIQTGVINNTLLGVSTPSTNVVRYTSNISNAFSNVIVGDYVIVWSEELALQNRFEGRVHAVTSTTLDIQVTASEYAAVVPVSNVTFNQGFVVLRSSKAPQKFEIISGTLTLDEIASQLQAQTDEVTFSTSQEEYIIITSNTSGSSGSLMVVSADAESQNLLLPVGILNTSQTSLIASYNTQNIEAQLPLFIHAAVNADSYATPPDSFVTSFTSAINLSGRSPNELVAFLQPYGTIPDSQPAGDFVQESSISGNTVNINLKPVIERLRGPISATIYDRFFLASPLDFGPNDSLISIVDNNPITNSFTIPFYRQALTNTSVLSNSNTFNATDILAGNIQFSSSFGNSFDFSNFKVLMQAKNVLQPSSSNTAILYRSAMWGRSGEYIQLSYVYPSIPNAPISSIISNTEDISISINLASGSSITTGINYSTQWNISVIAHNPTSGIDQVTFSWNGVGSNPSLTLSGGEYVNISSNSGFDIANTGIFRVSTQSGFAPTSTSFTIQMPTGVAVAQTAAQTNVNNAMTFYSPSATTANQIISYVNTNLASYVTASLANYNVSNNGSGTIVYSTYEDSGFINKYVQLVDGINWIAYSNLSANSVTVSGNIQNGSNIVSGIIPLAGIYANASISGVGIPNGTTISSISGNSIVMSAAATATTNDVTLTVVNTGTPQFTLKNSLSLPSAYGYAFNNSETIIFSPTTMEQVSRFISVLAVTGFTTLGTIDLVDRASQLELATQTLGSSGAIQIIGGLANSYETPVLGSATRIDNNLSSITVNSIAGAGIQSDQWFRLAATNTQAKETLFSTNTSVSILGNNPSNGQSTIQLFNRQLNQRYFGKPRWNVNVQNRTFRIEQQGSLVCLSANPNNSASPNFSSTVPFNDAGGGTINAYLIPNTDYLQFVVVTGNLNFNGLSIGDLVTISGLASDNNGTFLVVGVSDNGTNLQVLNPNGVNQLSFGTFTFSGTGTNGDQFVVGSTTLVEGTNFPVGGTSAATATNLAAAINTISGVTASANSNVVTVTATTPSASIAISTNSSQATASGSSLAGISIVPGTTFTATTQVSEGDTVILTAPFNTLNQGQFRVIRRYNDSVWFENSNAVEEEVNLPLNNGGITFGSNSTSFMINATNHTQYLTWNGVGVEPHLEYANMGDIINFSFTSGDTTPFSSANQGSFMVLRSGAKLQEIVSLTMPAGSAFPTSGTGAYFDIWSAGNVTDYRVWFNVIGGTNTAPSNPGTLIEVSIHSTDSSSTVANDLVSAIGVDASADLTASSSSNVVTVTTTGYQATNTPVNTSMPSPFSISVLQSGQRTFLECINPLAVNQSVAIVQTNSLTDNRPQIQFFEYNASVPGDSVGITNNAFNANNLGSWDIIEVINRDTAVVKGSLTTVSNISLNGLISSFYVEEGVPYYGYKQVQYIIPEQGSTVNSTVVFNTNAQSDQINQSAGVQLSSLNKMNFNTLIKNGFDAYAYNTGLIQVCNQIVYGDPTDNTTYPGVAAAGAEIFIRGPLIRRIQVSLAVRLNTGVPFAQTVQTIQSTVQSLINSNLLGQPLAISSIISAVEAIPGILSVAVSFPNYSVTNDLIVLTTGEKALIINPTQDISVSLIGN